MNHLELISKSSAFANLDLSHAYLFISDDSIAVSGLMKLTCCKLLCRQMNAPCLVCDVCKMTLDRKHCDVLEFDKDKIVVRDIEELLDSAMVTPFGNRKIYCLNNFDTATTQAQNKLLKIIEEPPASLVFVLGASTHALVLPTIKSRCTVVMVQPYNLEELKKSFLNYYSNDHKLELALNVSCGKISSVEQFLDSEQNQVNFDLAIDTLKFLKCSADIPRTAKFLLDNKESLLTIVKYMSLILRDVIVLKCSNPKLFMSKVYNKDIIDISESFTVCACLNILKKISIILQRIVTYGNTTSIVDNLMFLILEQKYNCRAEIQT
ncbi:MAG: hypothetical protein LBU60_02310 [Clostridiales bacterium]|jgi:DNA polymerase III delta prime subunit|nr:hypothetical protein [Clostridiales bacterium]